MFRHTLPLVAALAATLTSASALAGWDHEGTLNIWDGDKLQWAQSIHPQTPPLVMLLLEEAPPREQWCPGVNHTVDDTPDTCAMHDDEMVEWLRDFLDLEADEALPQMTYMPQECPSACQPSF